MTTSPYPTLRPTDDAARSLARRLIGDARFGALGTLLPGRPTGDCMPLVTRVALAPAENGMPLLLISALSLHARALRENPAMSLLLGDISPKGDALTQPRLSLICRALFLDDSGRSGLRQRWLQFHPKALVYVDLPGFVFVAIDPEQAFLNAGFGRAFQLFAIDLL